MITGQESSKSANKNKLVVMKFSACGCLLTIVLELCMVYAVKTKKCSIPLDPCRNDDDGCKVIYDFSALDFEDNLLGNCGVHEILKTT